MEVFELTINGERYGYYCETLEEAIKCHIDTNVLDEEDVKEHLESTKEIPKSEWKTKEIVNTDYSEFDEDDDMPQSWTLAEAVEMGNAPHMVYTTDF